MFALLVSGSQIWGGRHCAPLWFAPRAVAVFVVLATGPTAQAQPQASVKPNGYFANWPPLTEEKAARPRSVSLGQASAGAALWGIQGAPSREVLPGASSSEPPQRPGPALQGSSPPSFMPSRRPVAASLPGAAQSVVPSPPDGLPPSRAMPFHTPRRAAPWGVPPQRQPAATSREEDHNPSADHEDRELMRNARQRPTYFPDRFSWGENEDAPLEENEELLTPFLMNEAFRRQTQLHTFGWLQQSYTVNPAYPSSRLNGVTAPNDRANDYQMNELYLVVERRVNRNLGRADFGARVDLLYGTSAFAYQAAGLDNEIVSDSSNRFYQLAIPQAFVSAYFPNLPGINGTTLQAGHYYSTLGYEYLAPHNFFFSFANYNLGIPFTNTGGLATLQLSDHVVTQQGFSRGWDIFNAPRNNQLSYTGSLQWFEPDQETWIYLAWMVGPELVGRHGRRGMNGIDSLTPLGAFGAVPASTRDETELRAVVSLFIEQQVTERLEYALVAGMGHQNGSGDGLISSFDWAWVANYAYYTITPQWAAGLRAEWFHDAHGLLITSPRQPGSFAAGDLYEVTLGLNWQPQPWIRVRPEVRWDWQSLNDVTALPSFNDNRSLQQFLFAVDALVTF